MITLFSYPELFGVADNNPYGLKVFAFLRLCNLRPRRKVEYGLPRAEGCRVQANDRNHSVSLLDLGLEEEPNGTC